MTLDRDDVSLDGTVALVTGAGAGIGRAIALTFAAFGSDVGICDRDVPALDATATAVEDLGRRVVAGELDVRDQDAVRGFVGVVTAELGTVDILVNNAGGGFAASFLDVSDKGQDALVQENFTSVTNFVRAAVPVMRDGGSIINITSIEAHRAGPGFAIYSAMKAAVANLTKSLALELAPREIRVNAIAPDMIPTPGIGALEATTPLPYAGDPDDVAGVALFLASRLARFVTGTTLHVDGGNSAAGGWRRDIETDDGSYTTG